MIAAWVLAEVTRCASPAACPTDAQLLAATRGWDSERAADAAIEAASRDEIVMVHPRPPTRVDAVVCGDEIGGTDGPGVACSMIVRYADGAFHQVARLKREEAGWSVVRVLGVWRQRSRSAR